jgi:hypothetical protein
MGLDIYVGGLVRYFTGDWELVIQRGGRQAGVEVRVERAVPLDADPVQARQAILTWQSSLAAILKEDLNFDLSWNESPDAPYFTDKPDWTAYGGLLLWAAHDEHRSEGFSPPVCVRPNWRENPAYRVSTTPNSGTIYPNLLCNAELWLPGNSMPFQCPGPTGAPVVVGFVDGVINELLLLNSRTWKAKPPEAMGWASETPGPLSLLEDAAKSGFAIMLGLALKAQQHALPMKLDH